MIFLSLLVYKWGYIFLQKKLHWNIMLFYWEIKEVFIFDWLKLLQESSK